MYQSAEAVLISRSEASLLANELGKPTLMGQSLTAMVNDTLNYMNQPIEIPGHGEAGGYEHNKHKLNYQYIDQAGRLYLVTGDERYAEFAAQLLLGYADVYLTLSYHIQRNTNPTGRLFHQILNEHMFLLYSSLGYSCVCSYLSDEQQKRIIDGLFRPLIEMSVIKYGSDFGRIHNHGLWAVAAVGICGLAIGEEQWTEKSIHGLAGDDETGGFLAQISKLFAPSGYYVEGPYYHRFAIRPLCLFAEVLSRHRPELDIFNYKQQVIGKNINALLSSAYPNGVFPALNDASLSMDIRDEGVVNAVSLAYRHYGQNPLLLGVAKIQNKVWIHACGLELSQAFQAQGEVEQPLWPSVELSEGPNGDRGAQGFLRMQAQGGDISQLVMNYGQHGMGHGHFDTLGISFFNRGQEVLREYGFGRWVNIEPKFGGRYLDENKSYARQTIAHNLVSVDQNSQNQFDVETADSKHGIPHFFVGDDDNLQAMSAFADEFYPGVNQQRTLVLIRDELFEFPLLLDVFQLQSDATHSYDYALQYQGQVIRTNFDYECESQLQTLGADAGYQHLWNLANTKFTNSECSELSWLQGNAYYTWISAKQSGDELIFTRTGANDPQFNLRSETSFVLRRQASNTVFANVLESHGYFNEAIEASTAARGLVKKVEVLENTEQGCLISVAGDAFERIVMLSNLRNVEKSHPHVIEHNNISFRWNGHLAIKKIRG